MKFFLLWESVYLASALEKLFHATCLVVGTAKDSADWQDSDPEKTNSNHPVTIDRHIDITKNSTMPQDNCEIE